MSDGVETKQKQQKTSVHQLRVSLSSHRKPGGGHEPKLSHRVNCRTHQPRAATRVDGAKPQLVQNTISINYGG